MLVRPGGANAAPDSRPQWRYRDRRKRQPGAPRVLHTSYQRTWRVLSVWATQVPGRAGAARPPGMAPRVDCPFRGRPESTDKGGPGVSGTTQRGGDPSTRYPDRPVGKVPV